MNVLFLTNNDNSKPLIDWLSEREDVTVYDQALTPDTTYVNTSDFIVSYNYRHIIPKEVLDKFKNKAINLHPSYLPYNRGAYSNFFSAVDGTPNGVTIHYLSEGLDKGEGLIQQRIRFKSNLTLKESYDKLHEYLQIIFKNKWDDIKHNRIKPKKQRGKGTYHCVQEFNDKIWSLTIKQVHELFG